MQSGSLAQVTEKSPEQIPGGLTHGPKSQSPLSAQAALALFEQRKLRTHPAVPVGIPVSNERRSLSQHVTAHGSTVVDVVVPVVVVVVFVVLVESSVVEVVTTTVVVVVEGAVVEVTVTVVVVGKSHDCGGPSLLSLRIVALFTA
jgi:hypothetical protein